MHPQLYQQVFSGQTKHWWSRSRQELSLELLKQAGVADRCQHIDIGCGTGQNLGLVQRLAPARIVGIDVSPVALGFARAACPNCELVQANINGELPFREQTFDLATIFNVLYHSWVDSELAVLRHVRRILKPQGVLLITEPAFAALSRDIDVLGMTKRRYRLKPFVELLRAAELDILFSNYFTSFGPPVILGAKAIKALVPKSAAADVPDMRPMRPLLSAALYRLARIEAGLVRRSVPIPFGTTIICVARRS